MKEIRAKLMESGFENAGSANVDVARQVLKSDVVDDLSKVKVTQAIIGQLMTATTLRKHGVDVEQVCPLCKGGDDDLFHRCWECSENAGRRKQIAGERMIAEALQAGRNHLLFGRGVGADPLPDKVPTGESLVEWYISSTIVVQSEPIEEQWYFDPTLGPIFTDGSCELGDSSKHAHAAWAAVQIFADGTVARQASGPVPHELAHDSGTGEYIWHG